MNLWCFRNSTRRCATCLSLRSRLLLRSLWNCVGCFWHSLFPWCFLHRFMCHRCLTGVKFFDEPSVSEGNTSGTINPDQDLGMWLVLQYHTGFVPLGRVIASLVLDQHR